MEQYKTKKHSVLKALFLIFSCIFLFAAAEIYIPEFPKAADNTVAGAAELFGKKTECSFFSDFSVKLKNIANETAYLIEVIKENLSGEKEEVPQITGNIFTCAAKIPLSEYTNISSEFGKRELAGEIEHHDGTDFAAKEGTRIFSAWPGRVLSTGYDKIYGKNVTVEHGKNLCTRYCHLSAISVKKGDEVLCGELLGKVGSTGKSTGSHLHFEVLLCGVKIDPKECLAL